MSAGSVYARPAKAKLCFSHTDGCAPDWSGAEASVDDFEVTVLAFRDPVPKPTWRGGDMDSHVPRQTFSGCGSSPFRVLAGLVAIPLQRPDQPKPYPLFGPEATFPKIVLRAHLEH